MPKPRHPRQKDANGTTYIRKNRKTGQYYTARLCNPCKTVTEKQKRTRSEFGILNSAVNKWITENREQNSQAYQNVMQKFLRQDKYKLLRGFIIGTNMARIQEDGSVVITIDGDSVFVNQ